jgi:hypothetical protein
MDMGALTRRRVVCNLVALATSAVMPAARSQPSGHVARIGYLGPSAETAPHLLEAFNEGLAARELAVNVRTARALNLVVARSLLLQADAVFE